MADANWRIYMLGRLQARREQRTLNHLSMRRVGALLACLTLRAPHPVPREELLKLLWPEVAGSIARNRFSVLLCSLRQHLEPAGTPPEAVLLAGRHTVQLLPAAFTSDYHDFLRAFPAAQRAQSENESIGHLETAAALYQGELLAARIEGEMGHGAVQTRRIVRPMTRRVSGQAEGQPAGAGSLPPRLTRFFGREQELYALKSLLAPNGSTRLVTLLGPGGTGKTRLAVESAEQLKAVYSGRVYFAPLAELSDTNHVGSVIARTLHLRPNPGHDPLSQALAVFNQAPSLLVLDNLEQLLPDAGPLIGHLLAEAPTQSNVLVKRGSEWHTPDRMAINVDHIVFTEPVSAGSQLEKLIKQQKSE